MKADTDLDLKHRESIKAVAWLSSVRSVKSALKWDNERNLRRKLQVSCETALSFDGEEGEADVKSA